MLCICGTLAAQVQPDAKSAPAVPRLVKFSGALTSTSGAPLNGVVGVTFALYAEEHGGAPLWMETQNVQADAAGHYTATLGSTRNEGIPADLFASGEGRWLGVQAQGELEQPRVLMVSVPYALKAVDAETLGGLPPSAFALAGTSAPLHSAARGPASGSVTATPNTAQPATGVTPGLTGTGTANHLAYWSNSTTIASSALYQTSAKRIGLGTTSPSTTLEVDSAGATAILGKANATSGGVNGVSGQSASSGGIGVFGTNTATSGGIGVLGTTSATSGFAVGVEGQSSSPAGNAVFGQNLATTGSAQGVVGISASTSGTGVSGNALATSGNTNGMLGIAASPNGNGVLGTNNATTGFAVGVNGQTYSPNGTGVNGVNNATTGGNGVQGWSNATSNGNGIFGSTNSTNGNGVIGINNATSTFAVGVNGQTFSPNGTGVNGLNLATTGGNGVQGQSNATSNGNGVFGVTASTNGNGVLGISNATTTFAVGVNGQTSSPSGTGVNGLNLATTGGNGGNFTSNATSGFSNGVYAQTSSTNGNGVFAINTAASGFAIGVQGTTNSSGGAGVFGLNNSAGGFGLDGQAGAGGTALFAVSQTCDSSGCTLQPGLGGEFVVGTGGTLLSGYGGSYGNQVFYVDAAGNGYFAGNLKVTGKMTKGSGSFQIDHPLDPANKYLSHSFVESPDMMNVYNGVTRLNARGEAWVDLPDYFEALNGDFRYQLTAIGAPAPRLYVAREVSHNRFKIAGGRPGGRVSWQVTGIRHDPYANAHRIVVTEEKPQAEKGHYLHPDVYSSGAVTQSGASVSATSAGALE